MTRAELQDRTKKFHFRCVKLCNQLPKTAAGFEIAKQLIRSSGSVGSNYRASGRAKSNKDFIYKLEVVLEEADKSHYWLEIIRHVPLLSGEELNVLIAEADELVRIFNASVKTAKGSQPKREKSKRSTKDAAKEDPKIPRSSDQRSSSET